MIDIDFDKPRKLHFNLAAVRDLEAAMGKPLTNVVSDLSVLGVNALVVTLWAGLKHEDRTLHIKGVERLLQDYIDSKKSVRALATALNDALEEIGLFRNEDEAPEGNAPAAAPETKTAPSTT